MDVHAVVPYWALTCRSVEHYYVRGGNSSGNVSMDGGGDRLARAA